MKLKNQVAVVTGAAGILGRSFCEAMASEGAHLVLIGRTLSKLEELAVSLKKKFPEQDFDPQSCDVTDKEALKSVFAKVQSRFGKVDMLINGAGGNQPGATAQTERLDKNEWPLGGFFDLDPSAMEGVMKLNYLGTVLPCQVFGEAMAKNGEGRIVNISSMSALLPLTKVMGYSSAKAAIDNFTRWLAVHFSKVGIRVNALAPGFFVTEQNRFLLYSDAEKGELSERGQKIIDQTPLGRFGEPKDLSSGLLFLLDPESSFVNGIVLPVDGGFSAYSGV